MSWPINPRPAKSLLALVGEVNARWPKRDKASDGMLGDAAHASRDSDHNPWVKDSQGKGVVTAADIDNDSEHGNDIGRVIVDTLVSRRDRRVKYLIYKRRIWRSYAKPGIAAWTSSYYDGDNAHDKHVHVSVWDDQKLFDDTSSWGIAEPVIEKELTDMEHIYKARAEILKITEETLKEISQKRVYSRRLLWAIRRSALLLPKPKA